MTTQTNEFSIPAVLDAAHRQVTVGTEPMIFHCHHYNTFLQRTIQDADYIDSRGFLIGAAAEVAFNQMMHCFAEAGLNDVPARKAMAEQIYRWAGFGRIDLGPLDENGGTTSTPNSHYSMAWKLKFGSNDTAVDLFTSGWLAGALAAIYDQPLGSYQVEQTACTAKGDLESAFQLRSGEANYPVFLSVGGGRLTEHQLVTPPANNVDYDGIFSALTSMEIVGNDEGLIPAFGVYLTRHYANYYNRISFEFERKMTELFAAEGVSVAKPLLVEAGHVCAFNTFGGIMMSPEWDGLIKPTLKNDEDWVHGMTAAVNALGWGRWQIQELKKDDATFVLHDDYEGVGYEAMYGKTDHDVAYLAAGAAAGIMDLVYVGDIQNRPTLDHAFYNRLFKSADSFKVETISARSQGDATTTLRVYR
ncbi:MAG TPA: hypothetical protein ENI87_15160 [bacterium]|nr:hypothetical protein [bacterium]